ncbi:LysR substrate-binding domain-containing protein [Pararhizobium haloflavum]|uniref:LysR substrate-binding domain-containing protein n=1 Tax=Pararhizobium haloflavum TaxID=2037914 RepID=UPI0018E46E6D|nr:LysR substrate-binding domain-containing protein [Pararhizobium haloflavum]
MANGSEYSRDRLMRRGLKLIHLRLIAALADTGQISAAAGQLAISQPAASRLLGELDRIVGTRLHTRHPRGIVLSEPGSRLAEWAHRVLRDLDAADREIDELAAGQRGLVGIGAVTGPALELVLPVLRQCRVTHPGISANIVVDTSDKLSELLMSDRLDFYVGRIPQDHDHSAFRADLIGHEPVSLIVRRQHPLTRGGAPTLAQCVLYDWVLQAPGGLLRHTVETYLLERGLPLPARVISTSSTLMTLALISQSNAIAPIARSVAEFFGGNEGLGGRIDILPAAADLVVSPYSILMRSDRDLSPASRIIHDMIRSRIGANGGTTLG